MKRYYLFFRPVKPPKWWPRDGRRIVYVGVFEGGDGWTVGTGHKLTAKGVSDAKRGIAMDWSCPVYFQKVFVQRQKKVRVKK